MALKPDRVEHLTDLSFFMNETGERGGIVTYDVVRGGASGAAMDDAKALVKDVVNLDLTRQHINYHKDEVQKGSKVLLLKRGTVVTNCVSGTPTAANIGASLYFNEDGYLTVSSTSSTVVGRLLSIKDADGYAKVDIDVTW